MTGNGEVRCGECQSLLAIVKDGRIVIRCRSCKTDNAVDADFESLVVELSRFIEWRLSLTSDDKRPKGPLAFG